MEGTAENKGGKRGTADSCPVRTGDGVVRASHCEATGAARAIFPAQQVSQETCSAEILSVPSPPSGKISDGEASSDSADTDLHADNAAAAAEPAWCRDIAFWLLLACRHLTDQLDHDLKPWGLTAIEALALRILDHPEETTHLVLRERLAITKSGLSKLVARLQQRGLVQQALAPHSERDKWLSLTEAGRMLIPRLDHIAANNEFFFLLPLRPAQQQQFVAALRALGAHKGMLAQV